ncbi:hypothetical protein B0H99_104171 [Planomicrobium soli]|uniref:Uncharacterized protein n=1 Tax=Planomicrobium soli TaxID=1176648 RepID=A0A2P8H3B9_9BACL|nr:hypothetical protein B0H99_104171 [Planomicrobium soli]
MFNLAIKEYKVKTSEKEKLEEILSLFSEVKIIGESKERDDEETDLAVRKEKKRRYKELAGKALDLGDNIEELNRLSNREGAWREEED